jgi:hypothetical protein
MANEAVVDRLLGNNGDVVDYTIADGTAVTKGAIMGMLDPMTASLAAVSPLRIAGIAANAKVASDGSTRLGLYTNGIFKVYASGAISVGDQLIIAPDVATYPNHVATGAAAAASGAAVIGYALETAATGETFFMRLKL